MQLKPLKLSCITRITPPRIFILGRPLRYRYGEDIEGGDGGGKISRGYKEGATRR